MLLSFIWGEAFRFDWSEEHLLIGSIWRKIQLAHMKLCASRAFWLVVYPSQSHEMLFDAHTRRLTGLGGVARRGIYDNMQTAVDRVPGRGNARVLSVRRRLLQCRFRLGEVTGRERRAGCPAQDLAGRGGQRFSSFAELNVWLAT